MQGDDLPRKSRKPGIVREFDSCQGNVMELTKTQGNVRKVSWKMSCQRELFATVVFSRLFQATAYWPITDLPAEGPNIIMVYWWHGQLYVWGVGEVSENFTVAGECRVVTVYMPVTFQYLSSVFWTRWRMRHPQCAAVASLFQTSMTHLLK